VALPVITIFVRHTTGCKYAANEYSKKCDCRKHLRWTSGGKQHRKATGTRSWATAEEVKRTLEDQLAGRSTASVDAPKDLATCIEVFIKDKRVQGITKDGLGKYTRELDRLKDFCERSGVYTAQGISRELLTNFCETWDARYPSSYTRAKLRERYRGFFRYCFEAQWIERVPVMPKIKLDNLPTQPLTSAQFNHLLESIPVALPHAQAAAKRANTRALFLLMRWSGLAIRDALTLRKKGLKHDASGYRVATKRQKTGTDVSVPIPEFVATELLALERRPGKLYDEDAGALHCSCLQGGGTVRRWTHG
jgi:integrase/recombinase XerD